MACLDLACIDCGNTIDVEYGLVRCSACLLAMECYYCEAPPPHSFISSVLSASVCWRCKQLNPEEDD